MATRIYPAGNDASNLSDLTVSGEKALRAATAAANGNGTAFSRATVAGPTAGIPFLDGANTITWYTRPLNGVSISGTVTFNIPAAESNMAANAGMQVKVERTNGSGVVQSVIVNSEHGTELGTGAPAAQNWTGTATSTTLNAGDRLKFTIYANDAGGTMASGYTINATIGDTGGGAWVEFTQNFSELVTGTATAALRRPTVAASGSPAVSGTGTAALGRPTVEAEGDVGSGGGGGPVTGGSLSFDGVNDYANVADDAALDLAGGGYTVEFWAKPNGSNWNVFPRQTFLAKSYDGAGAALFSISVEFATVQFAYAGTGFAWQTLTYNVGTISGWHHFAFVYDHANTSMEMYLDGTSVAGPTVKANGPSNNNEAFGLGRNEPHGDYGANKLAEVRLWNVARTSTEISDYRDIFADGDETGLAACWHLNEGTGGTVPDATTNGNDLTINGATWDTADYPTLTSNGGGGEVTGTVDAALGRPSVSAAGTPVGTGTATAALGRPSLTVSGTTTVTGTGTAALGRPSLTGAGAPIVSGTGTAALGRPSVSASGGELDTVTGEGTAALSRPSLTASGTVVGTGTGTAALSRPTLSAAGTPVNTATATASLSRPTLTASGTPAISGTATAALGRPTVTAQGVLTGTGDATLPRPSVTASGNATITGTATAALSRPTVLGGNSMTGTITATLARPVLVAAGTSIVTASGAGALGRPSVTAAGTPAGTGTIAASLGRPTASASGSVTVTGSATVALGRVTLAGAGNVTVTGTATASLARPAVSALGAWVLTGTGTAALGRPQTTGFGYQTAPVGTGTLTSTVTARGSLASSVALASLTSTVSGRGSLTSTVEG